MKFFNKIHQKFITATVLILVVFLGISALVANYFFTDTLLSFAKNELKSKTESNANEISTFFDDKTVAARTLSQNPQVVEVAMQQAGDLRGAHRQEFDGPILKNYIKNYDDQLAQKVSDYIKQTRLNYGELVENIWVGDVYGQTIADSIDGVSKILNIGFLGQQTFVDVMNGIDSYLPPIWAPNPGVEKELLAIIELPIKAADNGVLGTLAFPMYMSDILADITSKTVGDGFNILMEERGHLLAFADEKYYSRRNTNYQDITLDTYKLSEVEGEFGTGWAALSEKMKSGGEGFTEAVGPDGKKYIIYYAQVKPKGAYFGENWSIASAISEQELFHQAKAMRNAIYIVIILALIVGSIAIYLISKRITKPIVKLTEIADKLNEGNMDVQVDITSNDEIGRLAASMEGLISGFKNLKKK